MGTRSTTLIKTNEIPILCMYRQHDGYPSEHGNDLFKFLSEIELVNSMTAGMDTGTHAYGSGCLAAQMIMRFKVEHGLGKIYIVGFDDFGGESFNYIIDIKTDRRTAIESVARLRIINSCNDSLFDGDLQDFGRFCSTNNNDGY